MKNIFNSRVWRKNIWSFGAKFLSKFKYLNKKNIVILFGSKGIFISVFINNKLIDYSFFISPEPSDLNPCIEFLSKFKNFDIYFLLDGSNCKARHESIPILQSLVKTDPIAKFIEGYFHKDDIIAHHIYDTITMPNEIWSLFIMSSPVSPPLSNIIEYVLKNRLLSFRGIHFLTLELYVIINKIVRNIENNKYASHFQIWVLLLKTSGIKFIIKHNNNIITVRNLEYPEDKTDPYIQGIIEQEINDSLILFKNYISNINNQVCIFFIVDYSLKTLLEQSSFENHQKIFIPAYNILNEADLNSNKFVDANISKLFTKHKNFLAYNNHLKSIERLDFIKRTTFKLFTLIIVILICIAANVKYHAIKVNKERNYTNEKYYTLNQEYDNIKYEYPYIKNTTSLADLYVLEKLLNAPITLPFNLLERLIINLNTSFYLQEIKWELTNMENILLVSKSQLIVKVLLKYTTDNKTIDESIKMLEEHMDRLKDKLNTVNINYIISTDNITNIGGKVVIPLFVNIIDNKI